jgi:hypothetical protein
MKSFRYKKWLCEWDEVTQEFNLYTPEELEQPKEYRQAEMECSTSKQCKEFINSY